MSNSEKPTYVFEEPYEKFDRDGATIFEGFHSGPDRHGEAAYVMYSVKKEAHVNEPEPHIHDFPIILNFLSANPDDIYDFDAEIEFYIDGEKHVITKTSSVRVPAGTVHCPLIFKRIGKPVVFFEVHLTDNYVRREA